MSSISSELTRARLDDHDRPLPARLKRGGRPEHDLRASKLFTALWGVVAVGFATFASLLDNLIEAVNILGSIFYGTVLGIFLVAFFMPRVSATPVLIAALIAQATVLVLFFTSRPRLPLVQRRWQRHRCHARALIRASAPQAGCSPRLTAASRPAATRSGEPSTSTPRAPARPLSSGSALSLLEPR